MSTRRSSGKIVFGQFGRGDPVVVEGNAALVDLVHGRQFGRYRRLALRGDIMKRGVNAVALVQGAYIAQFRFGLFAGGPLSHRLTGMRFDTGSTEGLCSHQVVWSRCPDRFIIELFGTVLFVSHDPALPIEWEGNRTGWVESQ